MLSSLSVAGRAVRRRHYIQTGWYVSSPKPPVKPVERPARAGAVVPRRIPHPAATAPNDSELISP